MESIDSSEIEWKLNDLLYGKLVKITENAEKVLEKASLLLKQGNIVAMPTETVYGLAANALDEKAVAKIFEAKKRPSDNPLIVHVSSLEMLAQLQRGTQRSLSEDEIMNSIPQVYHSIIKNNWPGPLTILVPATDRIPEIVTAGQPTVAVRFPAHPVARALIQKCGFPLAAPSANLSGRPSPTLASHVYNDLGSVFIIDSGPCSSGLESTVLDCLRDPPAILRPGGITVEMLNMPELQVFNKELQENERPTTPGMKYRHYTPNAQVLLFEPGSILPQQPIKERVGIIGSTEFISHFALLCSDRVEWSLGAQIDALNYAKILFEALRSLEKQGVATILVQGIDEKQQGLAVMNRLRKAASHIYH